MGVQAVKNGNRYKESGGLLLERSVNIVKKTGLQDTQHESDPDSQKTFMEKNSMVQIRVLGEMKKHTTVK